MNGIGVSDVSASDVIVIGRQNRELSVVNAVKASWSSGVTGRRGGCLFSKVYNKIYFCKNNQCSPEIPDCILPFIFWHRTSSPAGTLLVCWDVIG